MRDFTKGCVVLPDTREMPFRLVTPEQTLKIYTTSREETILAKYVALEE